MTSQVETQNCPLTPVVRFTWPGQGEKYSCYIHAVQLKGMSQALGFYLQLIPLSPEEVEGKKCSQVVEIKQ